MRKIVFVSCFISVLIAAPAFVQQQKSNAEKADSLLAVLPGLSGDEKFEALYALIRLAQQQPVMKQYISMLLDEARKEKNIYREGQALALLTEFYFDRHDIDSVFTVGEEAVQFTRRHKLYNFLFTVQQTLILRYQVQEQLITALRRAEEVYAEAKALQDNMVMARILSIMGKLYEAMNQMDQSLRCFKESQEWALRERQPRSFIYIENYNEMATLAGHIERFDESLRYADSLHAEIAHYSAENPGRNMPSLQIYGFCGQYHRALAYANTNRPMLAMEAIRQAEEIFNPQWEGTFYATLLNGMYQHYYLATGDYGRAMDYVRRNMRIFEDMEHEGNMLGSKMDMANILHQKRDFQTASETYRQAIAISDSLNRQQFYAQINELRAIYELDRAELETERRQAMIDRQRLTITGLVFACLAMLCIVALVVWSRRRIAEKNRGLFRQIMEQDRIAEQLDAERKKNHALYKLVQSGNGEVSDNDAESDLFAQLTHLMQEQSRYANSEVKRKDIADEMGISEKTLSDCIRNNTGMGFHDYINDMRLARVRRLLFLRATNQYTIEALSQEAGFKNRDTFYRLFRAKYGITPGELTKLAKQQLGVEH
jgi:AraC-like DNA-binding protein